MNNLKQPDDQAWVGTTGVPGLDHPVDQGGAVLTKEVKALLSEVGNELAGDVDLRVDLSFAAPGGSALRGQSAGQSAGVNEARLRAERAARRREAGEIRLKKVREGVGGVKLSLTMNERASASLCTLRFPAIETGIFLLRRVGSRVIGTAATHALMGRVVELIGQIESTVAHTEAAMIERLMDVPEAEKTLDYREALIANDITVYSPEARRLAQAIKGFDATLCQLRVLEWQGTLVADEERHFTEEVKGLMLQLALFLRETLARIENSAPGEAAGYSI